MTDYGYHLKDSIRQLVKQEQGGIKLSELTAKINGYQQLNYAPKTRQYKLLRYRIQQACKNLKDGGYITMAENTEPIFKTMYYTVTPTEKC